MGLLGRFEKVRIENLCGGGEASHSCDFQGAAFGKSGAPDVPEIRFLPGLRAIFRQAPGPRNLNQVSPALAFFRFHGGTQFAEVARQLIEIVDFSEQVLEALQILAPFGVTAGKKILDGVAKAFDTDAQCMPRFAAAVLDGVLMK